MKGTISNNGTIHGSTVTNGLISGTVNTNNTIQGNLHSNNNINGNINSDNNINGQVDSDNTISGGISSCRPGGVKKYTGLSTETTKTTVNNTDYTIKVDIKQEVLDKKQDSIKFIKLTPTEENITENTIIGHLKPKEIELLKGHLVNKVIYKDFIYTLSLIVENTSESVKYKYSTAAVDADKNEVIIDLNTGLYNIISSFDSWNDKELKEHIQNKEIHITQQEREYWNRKVSCSVTPIVDDSTTLDDREFRLNLER